MLLELFSEFTIDSGDNRDVESSDRCNITFLNPSLYVPFDQSAEWFSSKNLDLDNLDVRRTQEIFQNQAVLAYFRGDYITAMDVCYFLFKCMKKRPLVLQNLYFQIYLKMSENETLRTGDFAVTDSLIRCGLKLSPINGPQLLAWLEKLNKLVSTYGEQLQYWTLSLHVYLATGTNSTEYLRNAILLCASVDHPYHWTLLSHALPVIAHHFSNTKF
ncbi:unnamed protein product [Thelazia callipaeda]|uniref:Nucleoporin 98-96 n=1 Tax=Thelazia callipaeda TaxID=103827 RepID=A0A0N5D4P1_THECL|nr:unnamed protein product [Thelazia callipaeda]